MWQVNLREVKSINGLLSIFLFWEFAVELVSLRSVKVGDGIYVSLANENDNLDACSLLLGYLGGTIIGIDSPPESGSEIS